jgi:hypothetical protein
MYDVMVYNVFWGLDKDILYKCATQKVMPKEITKGLINMCSQIFQHPDVATKVARIT